MLTLSLLGEPVIRRDEQPLRIARRKSRALLFYLAAQHAPVARERLLALLWPDHPRQAAQQVLRTTLHGLRAALGDAIEVHDDTIGLNADVDVRVFETRLTDPVTDNQLLSQTLALYRGDFLRGFDVPEGQIDEWATIERERYRNLARRGWTRLAQRLEEDHNYPAALDAIERALQFEPLQEDLQRSAMRLHYRSGDRTAAIRRYEALQAMLDEELGVPPMAETRAIYQAIVSDTLPPEQPKVVAVHQPAHPAAAIAPAVLPFVGRIDELRLLVDPRARIRLALIEGEPGIGKTRLAHESIRNPSALIMTAAGRELERALPYHPIIEMLRGIMGGAEWSTQRASLGLHELWLQELARLVPELALAMPRIMPAPGPTDESRLWEAISQLLQAFAGARPVVLLFDDLQWMDASTLALLGYLARQPALESIRLLATTRAIVPRTPLAELVQALVREDRVIRLVLGRLGLDETRIIARHFNPTAPDQLAAWLQATTEGNPYILTELVRHAREHGLLGPDGNLHLAEHLDTPIVPQTVYSLMETRLHQLSDPARRVLDTAVAAGREWEWEVVARATGLSEQAVVDALDELQAAVLIRPFDETRYTFEHSLIMEVARREVGEPRHRLMHRRIAEALETMNPHRLDVIAGLLAQHFAEGNRPDRAAHYAMRAGQRAAGLAAWSEAIAFFSQALAGAASDQHGPILMELGEAQAQSSAVDNAVESFRRAIAAFELQPGEHAADIDAARLAMARAFLLQARTADVVALAQQVRAAGRRASAAMAEFLWGTALGHAGTDLDAATEHLETATRIAGEQSPPEQDMLAAATFELGNIAAQRGDLRGAVARYIATLAIVESATYGPALTWHILGHNNLAYHLDLLHEPGASEHAIEGLRLAREKGVLTLQPFLLSTLGEIALSAHDLDTAEAYFREGLALARRLAMRERVAGLMANLGRLEAQRGENERAVERLTAALTEAESLGSYHLAARIRLWLAPLVPALDARSHLAAARAIADQGARRGLLDDIEELEAALGLNLS